MHPNINDIRIEQLLLHFFDRLRFHIYDDYNAHGEFVKAVQIASCWHIPRHSCVKIKTMNDDLHGCHYDIFDVDLPLMETYPKLFDYVKQHIVSNYREFVIIFLKEYNVKK